MSKVDVNAIPVHKGTGKPITQVNIDEGTGPLLPMITAALDTAAV
jgi:hypothetical protein